ncbi:MAG: metal ABC transporter ATP-binding protein [Phycisphaerales bacterium]
MNAVEYNNLTYRYRTVDGADRAAIENITLNVEEGHRLGILGPNGGGKSTLLKVTLGLLDGYDGTVRVLGMSPAEARRRRAIGYVPQKVEAELAFPLSARQVVEMGITIGMPPWRRPSAAQQRDVDDAMALVGAEKISGKPIGQLSGGQLQRVMIARALAAKPRLLLLDEPTVGIDPAGQQQFGEFLGSLVKQLGLTLIVVSHDIRTIAAGCDRIACLSRTLHSHVAPEGLTPRVLAEVFRHDVAAIFGDVHVDAHPASSCRDPSHRH